MHGNKNTSQFLFFAVPGHSGLGARSSAPHSCLWNLYVVLLTYAMGRLSTSSENTLKADAVKRRLSAQELSVESKAGSIDVCLPAVVPYSVDEMLLLAYKSEYLSDCKAIRGYLEDILAKSPFYKEEHFCFGRSIFVELGEAPTGTRRKKCWHVLSSIMA